MTTNMNFGPEWMRPGVPKRSSTFDSQNARPMHSLNHPSGVNGGLQSFMALNQAPLQPGFNDESISSISDHPSLNATNLGQLSESAFGVSTENPYKYSKEFMLSLYRPVDPPADFERHEYVAVEEPQGPLSFVELSEEEKKLLAGPVHSEVGRRMIISNNERTNGQRNNNNNNNNHRDLYASPLHSPASENAPGTPGRMNMARSKGRMHDYFTRDRDQQGSKRHDQEGGRQREWSQSDGLGTLTPNKSRDDEQEPPAWGSVSQEAVGSFDSNGVFRLGGGNMAGMDTRRGDWQGDSDMSKRGGGFQGDEAFGSPLKGGHGVLGGAGGGMNGEFSSEAENGGPASMLNTKKPVTQYKWFYRDPQGTVQGPFEAQEMQEWYKAGFFAPTLLIRREDEGQFEPLIVLIRRLGTDDEPFLTPFPSSHSATGSPSALHMPPRSRALDPFSRGPASTGSLMGLDPSAGGGFFGNSSQASDLLSPQASGAGGGLDFGGAKYNPLGGGGGINNLSTNFLQQQMGQGPGSPHSPSLLQGPLNSFGSSLLGSRDSGSPWGDKPRTPSWLNSSGSQNDLFGGANDTSGMPPLFRQQQQQQPSLNPLFGSNMGSPGLFDYQRAMNEQMSHQQYLQLLQQKQQQHLQFQQQLQQQLSQQHSLEAMLASQQSQAYQQQQHAQQSPLAQSAFAPATSVGLESTMPTRPQASPAAAPGWGSAPGTPRGVGSVTAGDGGSMSNSWLQGKASPTPAASQQAAATIQTPENKVEPESTLDDIVTPMSTMQLKEEPKEQQQYNAIKEPSPAPAKEVVEPVAETSPSKPASAPAVKPVSLREIQAEEMQKQQELKEQQQKLMQQQQQQQQQQAKAVQQNGASTKGGWNVTNNSPWGGVDQTPKGPSLREIQEMEAKEAESRKQVEAQQMAASAASWANTSKNPTIVSNASSSSPAWGATAAPKKTLREIQQEEEEAMKKKVAKQQAAAAAANAAAAAAAAATASATSVNNIPSKGYAGIAGTTTPKSASSNGGSWTTVTNQRSAPKPAAPLSSISNNVQQPAARQQNDGWEVVGAVKSTPISSTPASTRPATAAAAAARNAPKNDGDQKPPSEEFMRWCRQSLRGLNAGVNGDEILQMLLSFPLDNSSSEIIQDIIYANSTSMDGRRFAAEFMKRRKADMAGKLNVTIPVMSSAALDEEETFQVVTKKGKKKTQGF